jgi:hypothetical protein
MEKLDNEPGTPVKPKNIKTKQTDWVRAVKLAQLAGCALPTINQAAAAGRLGSTRKVGNHLTYNLADPAVKLFIYKAQNDPRTGGNGTAESVEVNETDSEGGGYAARKRRLECEKLDKIIQRAELELQRTRGELLPRDSATELLCYVISNFCNELINVSINNMIVVMREAGVSADSYKAASARVRDVIAVSAKEGVNVMREGLAAAAEEMQDKKKL